LVHIEIMKYGYARVSTDGQSVEAQVRQLIKAGCKKVFRETASGAKTDRSQLRKALNQLDAGDVLLVTRLDRLARSTRDLPRTWLPDADRPWRAGRIRTRADPRPDRRGAGSRQSPRRKMGRPPKLTPNQIKEALRRRDAGEPMRDIARTYNVSHSTISRLGA
jgi:DNA invertase Pin-like site-specific DNA recombinase